MDKETLRDGEDRVDAYLKGTTYKVYRYMLKHGQPLGVSDIQRAIGLSSSSVSEYHIKKLLRLGLIKEEGGGYVIDKVVFENVIRIGRRSVPTSAGHATFFGVSLLILILFLRPAPINSIFIFALGINVAALAISLLEARKTLRRLR